jgi:predicted HTH transcriptional regulator
MRIGAREVKYIIAADDVTDAKKIEELDGVEAIEVGNRWVVGVDREAKLLGKTLEEYYQIIRNHIVKSGLSEHLRASMLASLDVSDYHGSSVVIIAVPSQSKPSFFNDKAYVRQGDQTVEAVGQGVLELGERFRDGS